MKKLLLTLIAVLTLTSVAVAETVTFPATKAGDWTEYTWNKTGDDFTATVGDFTFTMAKGTSSNDLVAPDKNSIRVYAGANLTIKAPSGYVMTEVSGLTASSSKAVGTSVQGAWTNETGTITAAANQVFKFTATEGQSSITFDGDGKQLRIKSITIIYQTGSSTGKESAELKFPQASYTVKLGEAFTAPALSKQTDAAPVYSSSKPEVATVDAATGAVTLVAAGTTVITAETAETEDFAAGKASYTLEVVDPNAPGATIDNPMTVAQALAACTADGPKDVYVKGIVKAVTTAYSDQFKNVTFTIVDAETDTEVLEAFRAKWGEGVTPTADKNPSVGATVVLYGNLKIYNGKKEFDAGNQIVKYTAPEGGDPEVPEVRDNSIDNPLSVAEALAACAVTGPKNVFVKGYVVEVTTAYSDQYKNVTFTIADTKEGTDVLTCYRAKWGDGVAAPEDLNPVVGATVIVNGDMTMHNETKELAAGNQIVKYDGSSSVSDIAVEEAEGEAVYYNLQGVRVANPENGLYIRVQGKKAVKVLVR